MYAPFATPLRLSPTVKFIMLISISPPPLAKGEQERGIFKGERIA